MIDLYKWTTPNGRKASIFLNSIADIAIWPWTTRFEWQEVDLELHPNVKRWYVEIASRPVQRGYHVPKFVSDIPMP